MLREGLPRTQQREPIRLNATREEDEATPFRIVLTEAKEQNEFYIVYEKYSFVQSSGETAEPRQLARRYHHLLEWKVASQSLPLNWKERHIPLGITSALPRQCEEPVPQLLAFDFDPKRRIASLFCAVLYTARVLQLSILTLGLVDTKSTLFSAVDNDIRRMVILELEFVRTDRTQIRTELPMFQPAVHPETLETTIP